MPIPHAFRGRELSAQFVVSAMPAPGSRPGLPMPDLADNNEEPWRVAMRETRFVPMQARTGDYALFFRKAAVEITFDGDRFLVVPQTAILALVREPHVED